MSGSIGVNNERVAGGIGRGMHVMIVDRRMVDTRRCALAKGRKNIQEDDSKCYKMINKMDITVGLNPRPRIKMVSGNGFGYSNHPNSKWKG